ncbi:MAG: ribosome small subunit-dependent GTPase A [Bryobacterales bacterium]|nr:ribosome small subunit-dependent GTPase A [Bryobacterales bacterium]
MNTTERTVARVCVSQGDRACVWMDGEIVDALLTGALTYAAGSAADLPVTGDWVAVRRVEPSLALIEEVLPRRSKISRRAAGTRAEEQVLAANVDLALIVCGLDGDFNVRRLERYLAIAREGGAAAAILLNKADVNADARLAVEEVRRTLRVDHVVAISAHTGQGCDVVEAMIGPGVTAVLLGSSGAGKSTLLNRILGAATQRTAAVRESDSRGRHTTTHRELMALPSGGFLIDTPGLREIQLWMSEAGVAAVFDDIAALATQCRFRDCTHNSEPGCAVRHAVDPGRLESFHKLRRESERLTGALTEKQRWRSIHKAVKQLYKLRGH